MPDSVDWNAKGVVGHVKNQHVNGSKCGCCWAFATVGVTECINAMATGKMVSLSEQQLVDCDHKAPYHDEGCEGGDFLGGMKYIIKNGGIDDDIDYPYLAEDSKCQKAKAKRSVVTIDGTETVPRRNETALMQAVAHHPVGVALCVGPYIKEWRAYTGGIFDIKGCHKPLDHGMVVVGYGEEDGQAYWLLKNSWGAEWGDKGFMKLKRGLGGPGHMGLAKIPAYPLKNATHASEAVLENVQAAAGADASIAAA
jgi:C1A family cysteine protease